MRPRRFPAVAAGIPFTIAVATLCWLEAPDALLGYDQMFHLVWARELLHGQAPELRGPLAPISHPLELMLALPLSALGRLGEDGMRLVAVVSLPATAVAVAHIGTRLITLPVGLLAAALLVSRPHLLELAQHGYPDIPALALMTWAGAVALDRPRRDELVLLLLAAVGLLRPEPWGFALLYAAWAGRGAPRARQARLAALALIGPVVWGAHDWLVAGAPFWSFTQARANGAVQWHSSFGVALRALPHHAGYLMGLGSLIVGVAGLILGLGLARGPSLALGAVGATFVAGFLFYGLNGLTLSPRYLVALAPVICLFAAIGALGWTALGRDHPWRTRWRAAGIAGLLVLAVGIPWDLAKHAQVRTALLDQGAMLEPLARGQAGTLRSCGPIELTTGRAIPYVAVWTGAPIGGFQLAPPARSLISPTAATVSDLAGRPPISVEAPAGMRVVAANGRWRLYSECR